MQQKCVLDGYVFKYNAPEAPNPPVKGVVETETILGRYFTELGQDPSRRNITMTWPAMEADMYNSLETKFKKAGYLAFTDEAGVAYTVIFRTLTPQHKTPGGGYVGVNTVFNVVSSP